VASFYDTTATFQVVSKSIIANSLVINSVDIEQSAEMISAARLSITFEQIQPSEPSNYNPEQPGDATMYGIEIQQPTIVPLSGSTLMHNLASIKVPYVPITTGALIDKLGEPFILDSSPLA
jgi:hypothetical protein